MIMKTCLGVIIDDKLNWKENILSICKKTSKGIGMLRFCKPFVSQDTLKKIYIIITHLFYLILTTAPLFGVTVQKY